MEHSLKKEIEYSTDEKRALVLSMCGFLMSKVKLVILNAQKNRQLSLNTHLNNLIQLIAEHLLPQYCQENMDNSHKLNLMHNLCYLLAAKAQAVFTSGIVRTCIDQNWDLKGYRSTLIRILQELGVDDFKKLQDFFDKLIQSQNLQSQSCIKAISHFIKNPKKPIEEDDLKNPVVSFQTSFTFVKNDIERFRGQNMKYECFQVLHPWAYDLDQVDFKYVISKDQVSTICKAFENSSPAKVFWLSFFKSQLSVSADEFIGALRELCILNRVPQLFEENFETYKKFLFATEYCVDIRTHAEAIINFVDQIHNETLKTFSCSLLREQIRFKNDPRQKTEYIDESKIKTKDQPELSLIQMNTANFSADILKQPLDLRRYSIQIKPLAKQTNNLFLKFTNVDTEELKDLEIKIDGNIAQFKVGEGDCNHYVITNDKKLWESQFMILSKNGNYYIRDLGIVHTSRIKVTNKIQLQLHQGALIDLGKVVHYHINKLTHEKIPVSISGSEFIVMNESRADYKKDDEAIFRARPTWISADENKEMVQNEIMLEATPKQQKFSVGRSNRRDVEIKLKAVSADHCKIEYSHEKGWFIHEKDKERQSSNGTFVFMKSFSQMDDHEPSDIIPLFNGMTISFINYELQVRIEPKGPEELKKCEYEPIDIDPLMFAAQPHPTTAEVQQQQEQQLPSEQVSIHQASHDEMVSQKSKRSERQEDQQPYDEQLQATSQKQQPSDLVEERQHEENPKLDLLQDEQIGMAEEDQRQQMNEELKQQPDNLPKEHLEEKPIEQDHDHMREEEVIEQNQVEENKNVEESPKQVVHKTPKKEDEEQQELLRSYSQHHIGEASVEKAAHQEEHLDQRPPHTTEEHHEPEKHHDEAKAEQHQDEHKEEHEEAEDKPAVVHHETPQQEQTTPKKDEHHDQKKEAHDEFGEEEMPPQKEEQHHQKEAEHVTHEEHKEAPHHEDQHEAVPVEQHSEQQPHHEAPHEDNKTEPRHETPHEDHKTEPHHEAPHEDHKTEPHHDAPHEDHKAEPPHETPNEQHKPVVEEHPHEAKKEEHKAQEEHQPEVKAQENDNKPQEQAEHKPVVNEDKQHEDGDDKIEGHGR